MKINQHFGGTHRLLLSVFFLNLLFSLEEGGHVLLKHLFIFNVLHGVISQKTELLMVTTVRTSDSTYFGLSGKEQQELILPTFSTRINVWYFNLTYN
jgi:hypothetical protein